MGEAILQLGVVVGEAHRVGGGGDQPQDTQLGVDVGVVDVDTQLAVAHQHLARLHGPVGADGLLLLGERFRHEHDDGAHHAGDDDQNDDGDGDPFADPPLAGVGVGVRLSGLVRSRLGDDGLRRVFDVGFGSGVCSLGLPMASLLGKVCSCV